MYSWREFQRWGIRAWGGPRTCNRFSKQGLEVKYFANLLQTDNSVPEFINCLVCIKSPGLWSLRTAGQVILEVSNLHSVSRIVWVFFEALEGFLNKNLSNSRQNSMDEILCSIADPPTHRVALEELGICFRRVAEIGNSKTQQAKGIWWSDCPRTHTPESWAIRWGRWAEKRWVVFEGKEFENRWSVQLRSYPGSVLSPTQLLWDASVSLRYFPCLQSASDETSCSSFFKKAHWHFFCVFRGGNIFVGAPKLTASVQCHFMTTGTPPLPPHEAVCWALIYIHFFNLQVLSYVGSQMCYGAVRLF